MRTLLVLAALIAIVLIGASIAIEFMSSDGSVQHLNDVRALVASVGTNAWTFAQPLLQLIIVLMILEWIFARAGIRLRINEIATDWNVQTFIAGLIIITFCIAALAGLTGAIGYLKEIVLIVVGFYFGRSARTKPNTPQEATLMGTDLSIDTGTPQPAPKGRGESAEEHKDRARRGFDGVSTAPQDES
jgi:hypothetical protein